MSKSIAIIGTGLVGRAWSIVFARAGHAVRLFDPLDGVASTARERIAASLPDLAANDLLGDASPQQVLDAIEVHDALTSALDGVSYVQESAPERAEVKRALYAELDALAPADAVLASSTSGIPASRFTEQLAGRERCLVAHPINPPHIIPLVEIVPAPWTAPDVVERTASLMSAIGQRPIRTTREVNGFIANRLQGALLSEAFRLVEDGVCGVDDVDTAIADGLGLRWSFIGPFETIDLNSSSGVTGYCQMLGDLYFSLAEEQASPRRWGPELVARIDAARRRRLPLDGLAARQQWRDRRLAALVSHRKRMEHDDEG